MKSLLTLDKTAGMLAEDIDTILIGLRESRDDKTHVAELAIKQARLKLMKARIYILTALVAVTDVP